MNFFETEASKFLNRPVELYHFRTENQDFYFTTSDQVIYFNDQTWVPQTINRTKIINSNDFKRSELTVSIAQNSPLMEYLYNRYLQKTMELEIYRYQVNIQQAKKVFSGVLLSRKVTSEVEVKCIFSQIGQIVLNKSQRFRYSYKCNNIQYDENCSLSLAANSDNVIVTDISSGGKNISFDNTGRLSNYYKNGLLILETTTGKKERSIINDEISTSRVVTIDLPIEEIKVGDQILVAYGCGNVSSGCRQVNNMPNYFGFEHIPKDDYFTDGVRDQGKGRINKL